MATTKKTTPKKKKTTTPAADRLTEKQERFVVELLANGGNQRKAYMAAYDTKKMSLNAIDREASVLLKNQKVAQRYEALCEAARKRNADRAVNRAARVIAELESIAFGEKLYPEARDENGNTINVPPSLKSRLRALEMLGKSEKLFTDKVDVGADDGLNVSITVTGGGGG